MRTKLENDLLVLDAIPLCKAAARIHAKSNQDRYQDMLQSALLWVTIAAPRFDPAKGRWSAYAYSWALRGIHDVKREYHVVHYPRNYKEPHGQLLNLSTDRDRNYSIELESPTATPEEQASAREILRLIDRVLEPRSARILKAVAFEVPLSEVCARENITPQWELVLRNRAIQAFKAATADRSAA